VGDHGLMASPSRREVKGRWPRSTDRGAIKTSRCTDYRTIDSLHEERGAMASALRDVIASKGDWARSLRVHGISPVSWPIRMALRNVRTAASPMTVREDTRKVHASHRRYGASRSRPRGGASVVHDGGHETLMGRSVVVIAGRAERSGNEGVAQRSHRCAKRCGL